MFTESNPNVVNQLNVFCTKIIEGRELIIYKEKVIIKKLVLCDINKIPERKRTF